MSESAAGQGFATGTAIATADGDRPVERLAIGDAVLDAAGRLRRVNWVGRLVIAPAWLAARPQMRPVRIAAGALGAGLPARDLVVAPLTGLGVALPDGTAATVPAHLLVNEVTIRREPAGPAVELYEPELAGGGVLAERTPAGLAPPDPANPARTIAMVRARALVSARAGCVPGRLLGRVEAARHGRFTGWALDEARPWQRVALEIVVNGQVHAATIAMHRRDDLVRAGMGDGSCAFHFEPMPPLPADRPLLVQLRRAEDRADLPGSPILLARPSGADEVLAALNPAAPAETEEVRAALRHGLDRLRIGG